MAHLVRAGIGPPEGSDERSGLDGEGLKRSKQGPRKRVSQACDKCRSRKDKCDGKKPVRKSAVIESSLGQRSHCGIWYNAGHHKLSPYEARPCTLGLELPHLILDIGEGRVQMR